VFKILGGLAAVALIAFILFATGGYKFFTMDPGENANVIRVIDGDTIVTDRGTVRLIGINTPELKDCGGKEARTEVFFLLTGKDVELVSAGRDKDKYGRLLRYVVYRGNDVGEGLIKNGFAKAKYDSEDGYDWHPNENRYHDLTNDHVDDYEFVQSNSVC
jgi:endonuclease YncB( thermonuclease family)